MKTNIQKLKAELKDLAKRIHKNRMALKDYQRGHYGNHGAIGIALRKLQWESRHKHIAYCILRGRTLEEIEHKNREDNKPDHNLIDKYCEEYKYEEEAICAD